MSQEFRDYLIKCIGQAAEDCGAKMSFEQTKFIAEAVQDALEEDEIDREVEAETEAP